MNAGQLTITPHAGQAPLFVNADGQPATQRISLAIAGIQGGKTWSGCLWAQLEIQKNPTGTGLICGLSKDQLDQVLIPKFFDMFPSYRAYFNKKERTIYLPTGGKVHFRSLEDPKYIEGITAHWAWIDEADLTSYRAYLVVRGRTSATHGRILLTSSLADNSWIAEYLQRINPDKYIIANWESKVNPHFSREEWDELKEELEPAIFRRRYEAKLSFATGLVYGRFDMKTQVVDAVPADEEIKIVLLGFDWGYVDPTAIIVVAITDKKNIYIMDDFSVEGASDSMIVNQINKFKDVYSIRGYYGDPSNKAFLKAISGQARIQILPGERDIFAGTAIIRNLIYQKRFFVLRHCEHVLWEMRHYKFKEDLMGRKEEPEDKHNHTLDAIRYVLATYPVPSIRSKDKKEIEVMNPFWARRTHAYQQEVAKKLLWGEEPSDILIP